MTILMQMICEKCYMSTITIYTIYPNDFLRFWPALTAGEAFDGVNDASVTMGAGVGWGVGVG